VGACVECAVHAVVAGYRLPLVIEAKYGEPNAISNPVENAKFPAAHKMTVPRDGGFVR